MHLDEHSSSKKRERHGWLNCAYCVQKWASPDCLISHIIKSHGGSQYQCRYCFKRQNTRLSLFLHQQNYHGEEPKIIIYCKNIAEDTSKPVPFRVSYKPYKCRNPKCGYDATSPTSLSNHLYLEHKHVTSSTDYQCMHCHRMFSSSTCLVLHSKAKHRENPILVNVRHVKTRLDLMFNEEEVLLSSDEDDTNAIDREFTSHPNYEQAIAQESQSALIRECEKGDLTDNISDPLEVEKGFAGYDLYRCGTKKCYFQAQNAIDFKQHITNCKFLLDGSNYLTCFHCTKQLKHVATLLEHLKNHGLKRYLCSLCSSYRSAFAINVKNHMRSEHKAANNFKLCSLNSGATRPEEEMFVIMTKNCLPRGNVIAKGAKVKDTFSPDEIDSIPPRSMTRIVLRCSGT